MDIDAAPWKDDIVTDIPDIKDGYIHIPRNQGWVSSSTRKKSPSTRGNGHRG